MCELICKWIVKCNW